MDEEALPFLSNCLFFALYKRVINGGEIWSRSSSYGWWRHYIWIKDGVAIEFYPIKKKRKRAIPSVLFLGTVRECKDNLDDYIKEF